MKLLFDLFPIIFFFIVYKVAGMRPDEATAMAQHFIGSDITASVAPILLATVTAVAASILQVSYLLVRRRPIEPMLWISLFIVVVFGSLTVYFRDGAFIMWKPTILYWVFASILLYGNVTHRNYIEKLLEKAQVKMPEKAWNTLQNMWIGFFVVLGILNLAVAYTCSMDAWVNFKLFGLSGLTFVFTIAIGWFMTKHAVEGHN